MCTGKANAGLKKASIMIAQICVAVMLAWQGASAIQLNPAAQPLGSEKGFISPVGITTDGTDAFVADYGANAIFKITVSTMSVTNILTVSKPISVAYRYVNPNKFLYIVTNTGGSIYNITAAPTKTADFGMGFTGIDTYKNIVKPSDVTVGTDGKIYVPDMNDNYIKIYDAGTGAYLSRIGGAYSGSYGNGEFYIPSSVYFDTGQARLIASDAGNYSPYMQASQKYNYKTKAWTTSANFYGRPKGKIQIYNPGGAAWERSSILHGSSAIYGQVFTVSGVCSDVNYIYLIDSLYKKIMVVDNFANVSKVAAWPGGSVLPQNRTPVGNSNVTQNPMNPPSGVVTVHLTDTSLINNFAVLKDAERIGSYLFVTDKTGRVFYFTVIP